MKLAYDIGKLIHLVWPARGLTSYSQTFWIQINLLVALTRRLILTFVFDVGYQIVNIIIIITFLKFYFWDIAFIIRVIMSDDIV